MDKKSNAWAETKEMLGKKEVTKSVLNESKIEVGCTYETEEKMRMNEEGELGVHTRKRCLYW